MKKTTVVHCKKSKYDIYIGRPGQWGNPFKISETCSREETIKKYEKMVRSNPEMIRKIKKELKGKVLGCWCYPKKCHGDVLAKIANDGGD